jgi:transposase
VRRGDSGRSNGSKDAVAKLTLPPGVPEHLVWDDDVLGFGIRLSPHMREDLHERGTKPVIPNRCNRKQPFSFSKRLYKLRWRIESAFNRLKDFRRIATRYDRLARNYLASVCLAAALVWWI